MDDIRFCAIIGVDCIENDLDKIEAGEQKYLGFSFVVKREDADATIAFIKRKLNEYNVPYEDVYVYRSMDLPVTKIWDRREIEDAIRSGSVTIAKKVEERSREK